MSTSRNKLIEEFVANKAASTAIPSSRTMAFGGAASCIAIIYLIIQIPTKSAGIQWSISFASFSLPLWIALALTYDIWISLNIDAKDLFKNKALTRIQAATFYIAGILTACSICLLIFTASHIGGWLFIIGASLGIMMIAGTFWVGSLNMAEQFTKLNQKDPN